MKPRYRINADGTATHISGALPPTSLLVDDLRPFAIQGQSLPSSWEHSIFDGGKFAGGFGPTQVQHIDYWTLRMRSDQLFNENLYARGIIRRLVTNEINTGLSPEACPDATLVGMTDDQVLDWSEMVETRFALWGKSPTVCDWKQASTFGALQQEVRSEALISGDVLVVLRTSQQTGLPMVNLVRGSAVQTPLMGDFKIAKGHKIKHGVELDARGRVVAYWVRQESLKSIRMPASGPKTGKRLAWLVFGTDKRLDDVRGQPLLSLVLQSLKEIDRYRDSTQRKATINSILAMFIEKTEDKMGTLPLSGGAVRRDAASVTDSDGTSRTFNIEQMVPGMVMQELQVGEKPVGFQPQGTDEKFGDFEESIIQAVAWCLEIPPEILRLSFSNNYSASQAAINEFKIAINRTWGNFGETFCSPVYNEWLVSEVLLQNIRAPGFLVAWRDRSNYATFGAWVTTEWYGSIKPSTDTVKQAKGSRILVSEGWSTNAREARINTGTKFTTNIRRLTRENELKAQAMRPMLELEQEFGQEETAVAEARVTAEAVADQIEAQIEDMLGEAVSSGR